MLISNIKSDVIFENLKNFIIRETYGMITSENIPVII